jgi:hypothetical protein
MIEDMHLRMAITAMAMGANAVYFTYSMDETFMWFVPMGGASTWATSGSKRVPVVGSEEKKGCTAAVTIKPTGDVLPMMLIYGGASQISTPGGPPLHSTKAVQKSWVNTGVRKEADDAGHICTQTLSHWMTETSLKEWVVKIIIPDYKRMCTQFGATYGEQQVMLQIDIYPVHTSAAFRDWLYETYPFIKLRYIPAGCTPVAQVLDTFVNRPFKHVTKTCCSEELAAEVRKQLDDGVPPDQVEMPDLLKSLPKLRVASLGWVLKAFKHIQGMGEQIKKAYEKVGTLRCFEDKKYQWHALLKESTRLFGPSEEIGGPTDTCPVIPAALVALVARSPEDEYDEDDGALSTTDLTAALLAAPAGVAPPSSDDLAVVDDASCYEQQVAAIQTALSEMTEQEQLEVASEVLKDLSNQQLLAKVMGKAAAAAAAEAAAAAAPKKRGRQLGSKNKPKVEKKKSVGVKKKSADVKKSRGKDTKERKTRVPKPLKAAPRRRAAAPAPARRQRLFRSDHGETIDTDSELESLSDFPSI